MRRRLSLLLFALVLAVMSLGGIAPTPAHASCNPHCALISCGFECCTFADCSTRCINVFCGN